MVLKYLLRIMKDWNEENEKYTLRIWLIRLGMNGDEYKTTRKILMEKLSGHSAFRTEAEKERWKQSQVKKHGLEIASGEVTENENQTKRNCGIFAAAYHGGEAAERIACHTAALFC